MRKKNLKNVRARIKIKSYSIVKKQNVKKYCQKFKKNLCI